MDARPDDDADGDDFTGAQHPSDPPVVPPGAPDGSGTPEPPAPTPPPTEDEVWASIVARLSDDDGGTDPAVLRTLFATPDGPPRELAGDAAGASGAAPLAGRDWDGTSQYDDAEEQIDELEHFVPPDPGPVLGGDPLLSLAWGAAAAAPIFLLVVVVAWQDAPALLVRAAAVVFVLAVGVLVWRMPQRREPTDGDGAVV